MTTPVRSTLAVALIGAFAVVLSGCAGNVIDDQKAEGATKASLERSLHEKISSVDCPANQNVDPGNTFTCAVDLANGEEATAILKILNEEADVRIAGLEAKKPTQSKESE